MSIRVDCPCGFVFEVGKDLVGGIANCPSCGKATEVPGLRDPYWRLIQVGAALLWAFFTAVAYATGGPVAAIGTAVVLAATMWLASRAF